jgi:translation initiation factor IF-2
LQLSARVDCDAEGVVVDARKDAGRGPLATLLITRGCLRVGNLVVVGQVRLRRTAMKKSRIVILAKVWHGATEKGF